MIRENEHFIRISEFNRLISGLVQHQHAPYIYERLGNKLHHFLLDEFQDTSRMQWLNMIPLIEESISKNHKNLIVGDAKQSIYRFNNGLAEQFVALPSIYNPENNPKVARQSEYFLQMGLLEELADNHRSGKSIVEFNNFFIMITVKYSLSNSNSIWNNYQIESFPHYTLIDATGYIVSNPALGPTPNGQYETIDKTFFHIQKAWHEANPNEKEYYERN